MTYLADQATAKPNESGRHAPTKDYLERGLIEKKT